MPELQQQFEGQDITKSVTVDFSQKLAAGGYSDVFRGTMTVEGNAESLPVAVKMPRYSEASAKTMSDIILEIHAEISLWGTLSHPNVLPLLGLYWREGHRLKALPGAVSPWCDDGTVIKYLQSARAGHVPRLRGPVEDDNIDLCCLELELLSQVTDGLAYLHERDIVHGDLKGGIVLVHNGIARLCDFGYSIVLAERSGGTSSRLGTHRWFAPESFEAGARRTREADIWALGCVALEVRTLKLPYPESSDLGVPTAIQKGVLPYDRPRNMFIHLWRLAVECWSPTPSDRPTSQDFSDRLRNIIPRLDAIRNEISSGNATSDLIPLPIGFRGYKTLEGLLKHYPTALVQYLARAMAAGDADFVERLKTKFGTRKLRAPLQGHDLSVACVAFLPDCRRLVSSSKDGTLRIWDVETGETVVGPLKGHTDIVCCVAVHGSRVASCSYDGTFRVWDTDTGNLILGPISAHDSKDVDCIAYSSDGAHIATGGSDNRAALWDAITGAKLREMVGHTDGVMCVAFFEDGRRFVSGSQDGTIRIWDVASGTSIGKLEPLTEHTEWVTAVRVSSDGKRVYASSVDTIRVWDTDTSVLLVGPMQADEAILSMALSPDHKRIVAGLNGGNIGLWDAESGAAIPTLFMDHTDDVWGVAFSPDGRKIASASADKTIALWDATVDWRPDQFNEEDPEKNEEQFLNTVRELWSLQGGRE